MGEAIARQHPAVVLRSQFNQLRALLAVALIAVTGLTAAVAILAPSDNHELAAGARGPLPAGLPKGYYEGEAADVTPAKPRTADVPPGQPRVIQRQGSPALVNQSREATGDYAHGPLPPAAPTKDYSKNGATGDYSPEPQAQTGSRSDGQLRAGAGN